MVRAIGLCLAMKKTKPSWPIREVFFHLFSGVAKLNLFVKNALRANARWLCDQTKSRWGEKGQGQQHPMGERRSSPTILLWYNIF